MTSRPLWQRVWWWPAVAWRFYRYLRSAGDPQAVRAAVRFATVAVFHRAP